VSLSGAQTSAEAAPETFPARSILFLVLIALAAFAGFTVLATYAPEIRARADGGAHALSSSAVGYRGALVMLDALGASARLSRARPTAAALAGREVVLTPGPGTKADDLPPYEAAASVLIVLPKWDVGPDPVRPGYVYKAGYLSGMDWAAKLLERYGADTRVVLVSGAQRPTLHGAGPPFAASTALPLGRIDALQTIVGPGWRPALVDDHGRMVLAVSISHPNVAVLADPDLLNNQGLVDPANARAGMAVLQAGAGGAGVAFDVALSGFGRGRSLLRLMIEPPWLGATLCGLAVAGLMGWRAVTRFGAPAPEGRAIALGAAALVDNSAGLIRMARKEAALAPDYAATTFSLVALAGGAAAAGGLEGEEAEWLARAAERRGLETPDTLAAEAGRARTRDELMAVAEKLYRWRLEMVREHS
jgi:hypothetical protein